MTTIRNRQTGQAVGASDVPVRVRSYQVGPDAATSITVLLTNQGPERWAVRWRDIYCWNHAKATWVHEPQPSGRSDDFLRDCRFPSSQEAIRCAQEAALLIPDIAWHLLGVEADGRSHAELGPQIEVITAKRGSHAD